MEPVGILYAIDALARGGTEKQLLGLIARLDRARFRPHLLTLRPTDAALAAEASCPHLALDVPALLRPGAAGAVRQLAGWLRRERIEVVHSFFQDATLVAAAAGRLAGVPVRLAGLRDLGFWRTRAQVAIFRAAKPLLTGWVANSRAVRDHAAAADRIAPARIAVIPNGVDPGAVSWREERPDPPQVGLLANLNRAVKRPDLFLRAAAIVAADRPDVLWHLAGDGALRPTCERLAAELGIAGRVRFHGRVADPSPLLAGWSVGVLCSDSEGFPNALLEYMLAGSAVVSTAVGGCPELIEPERTGLLVPPDDPPALAAAIARLLAEPDLRRRLAAAARREAETAYAWDRCVRAHEDLYLRLLAAAGAGAARP